MVANILKFLLLIEIIFNEVITSYAPQRQKYIQVPSQQYYQLPAPASTSTAHSYASSPTPAYQSMVSPTVIDYSAYIRPKPYNAAVEKIPTYQTPVPAPELPAPIPPTAIQNAKDLPSLSPPPFDTNVLNNLAIALQLLIVSNLLNMPVPEQVEKSNSLLAAHKLKADEIIHNYPLYREPETHLHAYPSASCSSNPQAQEYQAYFEPNLNLNDQSTNPQYFANSNFLGSSNTLGGLLGPFGVPPAKARPGLNLKSPYDAIASAPDNTPPSPFEYRKRDFQSPYSAILAADNYKDLFSMDFY